MRKNIMMRKNITNWKKMKQILKKPSRKLMNAINSYILTRKRLKGGSYKGRTRCGRRK